MKKPLIGVSYPCMEAKHEEHIRAAAEASGYDVKFGKDAWAVGPEQGVPDDWYEGCEILFGYPPVSRLAANKSLQWLQTHTSGVEAFAAPGVLPEEVILTNAAGAYGSAIAEHVIGQLLMLYKRSYAYFNQQQAVQWENAGPTKMVRGSVITIIGFGDIGSNLAARLHAFGAVLRVVKRTPAEKPGHIDALYTQDEIDKALDGADAVILCVPNTPETANLLNRERIFALKPGAVLINVARGAVLDQEALYDALRRERLGGASLDVFDQEPLRADSLLWKLPNLIITPHISGDPAASETVDLLVGIFLDNLRAYTTGAPMRNVVDRARRY